MKTWFKRYGFFFRPVRLPGWIFFLAAAGYAVWSFFDIDGHSHSVSDTLMNFAFRLVVVYMAYSLVAWLITLISLIPGKEFSHPEGCLITELVNHPGEPGFSVARARILPGGRTSPHMLEGTEERYIVLSGTGRLHIGNQPYEAIPGFSFEVPEGEIQWVQNTGREDLVVLVICRPRYQDKNYREAAT
jgi:mannose-6-phosphate isomerase-like protein (cupin superfamily)